mmetsp:Transcript_7762/g.23398  ORF Transcript_7762/g.23398 Transcript_7762/m.23398 type:complete len:200 (+) Transcript_7762:38-637(+)
MRYTGALFLVLALVALAAFVANQNLIAPTELTYWEEETRLPSQQQRWLQWMSHNDAGPPVGALGHGWDGLDRTGMFPGEGPKIIPRFPEPNAVVIKKARTMSLDELDHTLLPGSDGYLSAHKYLQQLEQQSVAGQKAYVAAKAAKAKKAMAAAVKQAKQLYAYTMKHGYGKDLTRQYMANLKTLRSSYTNRPHHQVDIE